MRSAARLDRFGVHSVIDDPVRATLILFVETSSAAGHYFERVRDHPVFREFRGKSYLFSSTDKLIPFLPGVFASIEARWYWRAWARSGSYLGVVERESLCYEPDSSPSLLFSFIGSARAIPLRQRILALDHSQAELIDTHAESLAVERGEGPPPPADEYRDRYARSIKQSAFVLCPRGGGTASFRLFETMMLGRVPVVISDQWVPPEGPDWERFIIRVRENRVSAIPELLEARRNEAPAMGMAARQAWLEWFSETASFHRTVEWCLDLDQSASKRSGVRRYQPYLQLARPYHAARALAKRFGGGRGSF